MLDASETPPHHPTYNVRLTKATIAAIVGRVYPSGRLLECHELGRGKSFNNRIYFLDVEPGSGEQATTTVKLVLKVCGHYFGATKVQNEVSALQLLQRFCPNMPVPELLAWSETGKTCCLADGTRLTGPEDFVAPQGWVLQTRLPGRILSLEDLDGPFGASLLRQLAQYMAAWRTLVPSPGLIGNLRFAEDGDPDAFGGAISDPDDGRKDLSIGGLILMHQYNPAALEGWADYYSYQLRDQYEHLLTTPQLASLNTAIGSQVSQFLLQLPRLPFLSNSSIRFSHMDFSPRNVLVSSDVGNGRLHVTGILDFEFAAFLPGPSEFLNSLVNQADDWPRHHYGTFMSELHRLESEASRDPNTGASIDVPAIDPPSEACKDSGRCLCSYHTLQHLSALEGIIGSTAPWWINSTSHLGKDDELEKECQKAAETVLKGIQQLQIFFKDDTS